MMFQSINIFVMFLFVLIMRLYKLVCILICFCLYSSWDCWTCTGLITDSVVWILYFFYQSLGIALTSVRIGSVFLSVCGSANFAKWTFTTDCSSCSFFLSWLILRLQKFFFFHTSGFSFVFVCVVLQLLALARREDRTHLRSRLKQYFTFW